MIYGPGGYKYMDFVAIGTPLQLLLWIASIALLVTTNFSNFYISWLVTFAALLLVTFISVGDCRSLNRKQGTKTLAVKTSAAA
jgi:hypothetical protein